MSISPSRSALSNALTDFLGSAPVAWEPAQGGYTAAARWICRLESGEQVFVKVAADEHTVEAIMAEIRIYHAISTPFMPKFRGSLEIEGAPVLILEDLSKAHWPPPWSNNQIHQLFDVLPSLHRTPAPEFLPTLESKRDTLGGWLNVQENPEPFLSLGFCSASWLRKALPALIAAERSAVLAGDDLVHMDIRGDNVCFRDDQVIVIDWNHACCGNGAFDLIGWLPSLYLEGGPAPWDITLEEPGLIAIMSGYFASRSPLPPPRPGTTIRQFQKEQLKVALPWTCKALGIDIPKELQ